MDYSFYNLIKKMTVKYSLFRYGYLEPCHIRMKFNLNDLLQFHTYITGCHEDECRKLLELLPEGGVFFDIGGNIGTYSFNLSSKAKEIFTFEATKITFDYFVSLIKENGIKNIYPQYYAVHNIDGLDIPIYGCNPSNIGANSMYREDGVLANMVKSITLDTFCQINDIKSLDVIKIDIEGNELNALKGGVNTIARFKPIILCEVVRDFENEYSFELFKFITECLCYQAKVMVNNELINIGNAKEYNKISNIFFFPKQLEKNANTN